MRYFIVVFSLVVEGRGADTGRQHSHQDREPKPVCASFHQPSRGDRDAKQGNASPCSAFLSPRRPDLCL